MSKELEEPLELGADVPPVESPYADLPITPIRHFKLSAFWFGTNFLWGALLVIMLQSELRRLAPHAYATALGLFTGFAAIVALIVPLIVGAMSDRCAHALGRRRPYIIVGAGINVVGLFLMAIAYRSAPVMQGISDSHSSWFSTVLKLLSESGYVLFLLAYMVVQFGNNIATAAYMGVIPDLVPEKQRGTASGYMAVMSQVGTLFGVASCGLLLHGKSDTIKYLLLSTVLMGVALITVMGIRETPLPVRPPPMKWGPYVKSLWISPKKYPNFAWVWVTRALVMLGFYSVQPYIQYFMGDVIGSKNPDKDTTLVLASILIFSSVSGYLGGYLSDRLGRKRIAVLANASLAVMGLTFILCHNLTEAVLAATLFGIGYGAYVSVDWALGTDVLPSRVEAGKEMAIWHISMTLPQTLAAPIASSLLVQFGNPSTVMENGESVSHYQAPGYWAIFILASVCFGLGAYFLRYVKGVD